MRIPIVDEVEFAPPSTFIHTRKVVAFGGILRVTSIGAAPPFNPMISDSTATRLGSAVLKVWKYAYDRQFVSVDEA